MPPVPKPDPTPKRKPRRPRSKNYPRSVREFERTFCSVERLEWVRSLPSCYSGAWPGGKGARQIVNAHVGKKGAGTSCRADYDQICPLTWGEHTEIHQGRLVIAKATLDGWWKRTQERWLSHCEQESDT